MDQTLVHISTYSKAIAGIVMQVSVTEAKAQLTELIRRAESGEEVVLTRHGRGAVRLVPVARALPAGERKQLLEAVRAAGMQKASGGESAARSQDFLYDSAGLPR
jgi:prevent-host-death family protein